MTRMFLFLLIGAACALLAMSAALAQQINYRTSWIGNNFPGGGDGKWVQYDMTGLWVSPDGTVYTDSAWDEGGRESGIYKNGDVIGACYVGHGNGGNAVTGDGSFIYVASGKGISKFLPTGGNAVSVSKSWADPSIATCEVSGLAASATAHELYISDLTNGQVVVYDTTTLARVRSWSVASPGPIAVDSSERVWVISTSIGGANGKVLCFTAAGAPQAGLSINDVVDPRGIAFDPTTSRLLVADNGPDMQVRYYDNIGSAPKCTSTLGDKGGIYSGAPGLVGEQVGRIKFNGLGQIAVDGAGNVYTTNTPWVGSELRAINPAGRLLWELNGLLFVTCGCIDPGSDTDVYTLFHHFKLDYTQPTGKEWKEVGYTSDPLTYPQDPRNNRVGLGATVVRRIAGRKFVFMTGQNAGSWICYRFDAAHGETAIPCAWWASGLVRTGSKGDSSFPPGQLVDEPDDPGHSHWLWEDANGDGKFDPAEFHVTGGGAYFTHLPFFDNDLNMWFDDNGNFWDEHGFVIREYKFLGLDSHGSPTWNYATPVDWGLTNYQEIHRVFYYPSTDTMIIVGNTQTIGGTGYIGVGRVIDRYDHWSAIPGPTAPEKLTLPPPSYEIVLPDPKTMPEECMGIAGNYIFVGTLFSAVQQIYDLKTGVYLGSISPGPEVRGQSGWIDMSYGVQPFQRANGEYEVLAEEDAYDKNILYRLRLPDSGYGVGEGLRADYYAGTNFEKLTATRVVPQVKPAADGTGGYSVKWTGQLRAVTSGSYVLHLLADAGARLTLNGVLAVDHWLSTPTRATYTATLSAGQLYPVELDYFHNKGNAHVVFSWTMPGASSATPIPRSQLYPAAVIGNGAGLHGDYYTGTKYDKLSFSRIDPTIDFDWSQKATDSRLGLTGYSVKWSGTIEPEYSERYKFSGKSDDGMRVTINGVPVVDHLVGHGEWTGTMPYDLVAGQRYPIQIEYYQDRGAAFGHLSWESASTPQEIVPTTQLYPAAPAFPIPSP